MNISNYTVLNYTPLNNLKFRSRFKSKWGMCLVFAVILTSSMIFTLQYSSFLNSKPVIQGVETKNTGVVIKSPVITPSSTLDLLVYDELQNKKDKYAVAVKNLETGESLYINEDKEFLTASLYKIWVMAVVFQKIEEGSLSIDDNLKQDVTILNKKFNIATEDADLQSGTVEFTVREALNKMITVSDNYAALLLNEKIGVVSLSKFLLDFGFDQSQISQPPVTTAHDMNLFFEKLYRGEFANEQYTNDMIELLLAQELNDSIPKYITDKVKIAHKTGHLYTVTHDAGIVYTANGDYIITIMSEGENEPDAKEMMAKISERVYEYFSE